MGVKTYLEFIKFSHTIFAMPFALLGLFIGFNIAPHNRTLWLAILVVLCMIFARSAAMAFNRLVDRDVDSNNPRTKNRHIPRGMITSQNALIFVVVNAFLFIAMTFFINRLCFLLSPVALAVVLGYSYAKRFTWLSHLILGLGLGLAPIGACLAITGYFEPTTIAFGLGVLFWVGGFDILYALQDEQYDREVGLNSIPAKFGSERSRILSISCHVVCLVFFTIGALRLVSEPFFANNSIIYLALGIFFCFITYQHYIVRQHGPRKIDLAFFTSNGIASLIFCALLVLNLV